MGKTSNGSRTGTPEEWFEQGAIKVSNGQPVFAGDPEVKEDRPEPASRKRGKPHKR